MVYITLFTVAFLSATLLPMGSEAVLLYDASEGYNLVLLWFFASVGNILGALLNYWLGLKGEGYLEQKGYLSAEKMGRAKSTFDHYGGWALLLSWMPVIGDPLTFIAGVMKYDLRSFVLIVAIAKSLRYALLIYFSGIVVFS